jgi:parvulin-like peptidyl-prolyl isomerase
MLGACEEGPKTQPSAPAQAPSGYLPEELPRELAERELARVGERTITLGDYAATLARMDEFERLRYQSSERRQLLLEEIIKLELLAQEAKRRGLDQQPETRERERQLLRDELLRRVRESVAKPEEIPESEVRRYFDEHRAEFRDPERRRVAHIVVSSRSTAEKILPQALAASPTEWGKLVHEHSLDKPKTVQVSEPVELAGDLGIVSAVGETRGDSQKVPEPVRAAVFAIKELGGVHPEVVEAKGRYHLVRLTGKTDARERSFAEAERAIRVAIVQRKIRESERRLEEELRQKYPVEINQAALKAVKVPGERGDASSEQR